MENEERSLFFDKEEYEDEDGHFPISDYFDSQEAIAYGNYGPQGRKINLHISHPKHLNLVILKSDAATVSIPELQLEESPGTGRFATVSDLLVEMNSKLQQSAGYFSGPFAVKFSALFTKMQDMLAARKPFTLVIDDPLSNSFLKKSKYLKETDYDVINYNRTWDINEEYGLLETPHDYYDNHLETSESARKLAELIKNSRKIAAFTGAGISVESGVPAFRMTDQTNDIWSKYSPSDAEYGSFINSEESRGRYWELKTHFYELLKDSKPNPAHKFFGYLNEQDKLLSVVTQNIDGLHETGGVPAEKMVHIHGTELEVTCMDCGKVYSRAEVHEKILSGERVPRCECGGILKSGTILFGQPLDIDVVNKAKSIMEECDLLIIVGSSLVVQPANKLPGICLTRKVPVVLITQTETKYDNFVDLVISEPCGQFLGEVLQQLQSDT